VDEPEEELEEGEVKSDSPLASSCEREGGAKKPISNSIARCREGRISQECTVSFGPSPAIVALLKPSKPMPPIPKTIPKKRPLEVVVERPIKKARPVLPPSALGLPKDKSVLYHDRQLLHHSRPGTVEKASTQGSEGIPKPEPKSPVSSKHPCSLEVNVHGSSRKRGETV
jgi:hypothetical protein